MYLTIQPAGPQCNNIHDVVGAPIVSEDPKLHEKGTNQKAKGIVYPVHNDGWPDAFSPCIK